MPGDELTTPLDEGLASLLKRNVDGLVPVVVQDATDGSVLMMAWANDDALAHTIATREATYWSRSRQELWIKGATSGHTQRVREIRLDCDADTLLYRVDQVAGACHTGDRTCFDATVLLADESLLAEEGEPVATPAAGGPTLEGSQ